jgi:hypothetical protein
MNMRDYDPHRSSVENSLNKPIATLVWHSHKWRDASMQGGDAQLPDMTEGQSRMLNIDEQRIVSRYLGYVHDLHCRQYLDP